MTLGQKIKKLRTEKNLTQKDLADRLYVTFQTVSKWENDENEPDVSTLRELSKVFDCSLDYLLSEDEKVIEVESEPVISDNIVQHQKKPLTFRRPFDSGIKLNTSKLADIEHGYVDGKKKLEGYSFEKSCLQHRALIKEKNYTKVIRIQKDVCVDFFIDDVNKLFGFFFEGATQFLCPFENFAAFSVTNSGLSTGYTKAPVLGVGFGNRTSIGVGSMPLGQTRLPLRYDCSISYFDENRELKIYKIGFSCSRMYITYDGTVRSTDEFYAWENILSQHTNKNLNEVSSYLNGIKEAGTQIKNGDVDVKPVDISNLKSEVNNGQEKMAKILNDFDTVVAVSKKRKKKYWLIGLITVVSLVTVTITTCSIVKTIEKNQIEETNRNKAQEVIDLINAIGVVTLSSEEAIKKAEKAYNALTSEQKLLVTNYGVLISARSKYEKLLNDKREEETKDDPTRTIVVTDLNGQWESDYEEWSIGNVSGATAVLYWRSGDMGGILPGNAKSSYLVGYDNIMQKMKIKLYHISPFVSEWLDVTMTKSSTSVFTLYFKNQVFYKNT